MSEETVPAVDIPEAEMVEETATTEDLEAMRKRVAEMEAEAEKLKSLQADNESVTSTSAATPIDEEQRRETDARSIYVGNVDYGSTPQELAAHFQACGTINLVTIPCDRFSGHSKGYAYIEFAEKEAVQHSLMLTETPFRNRNLKVVAKRTNVPGMTASRGRGRGRGGFRRGSRRPFSPRRSRFRNPRFAPY
eukprot:TRINITY_DN9506_c0_g1_i1.p1 TRINITY_DN9506_c0_g1~~TRINITY_DN9506_c0_g1_i1.p1  ORF type:complete len:199 (+),score=61.95 TRINITY_DN9506_c0_g1_i1:23-598(+)